MPGGNSSRLFKPTPTVPRAHHDLGAVLGKMGLEDRAIECFRRAIELRPSSGSAYGNLGLAFLRRGPREHTPWSADLVPRFQTGPALTALASPRKLAI